MAEFAVLPAFAAAVKPAGVTYEDASCLPVAGLTALQALRDSAGLPLPGARDKGLQAWRGEGSYTGHVLVANATGGVGHMAAQVRQSRAAVQP